MKIIFELLQGTIFFKNNYVEICQYCCGNQITCCNNILMQSQEITKRINYLKLDMELR